MDTLEDRQTKELAEIFTVGGIFYGAEITQRPIRYFKSVNKNEWIEIDEEEYTDAQWREDGRNTNGE